MALRHSPASPIPRWHGGRHGGEAHAEEVLDGLAGEDDQGENAEDHQGRKAVKNVDGGSRVQYHRNGRSQQAKQRGDDDAEGVAFALTEFAGSRHEEPGDGPAYGKEKEAPAGNSALDLDGPGGKAARVREAERDSKGSGDIWEQEKRQKPHDGGGDVIHDGQDFEVFFLLGHASGFPFTDIPFGCSGGGRRREPSGAYAMSPVWRGLRPACVALPV